MTVSLRDVVLAVGYGDASLVGESAGYLILGAADCTLAHPERPTLDSVTISEDGVVKLQGPLVAEDDAERALRDLLSILLSKVRIPSANLDRVAHRRELRGLRGLIAELEAALVPVNRRAARRTLARLCRESRKSAARERTFARVEDVPLREEQLPPHQDSPEPVAVAVAPTPPPAPFQPVIHGMQAEQVVETRAQRVSQLPTKPASRPLHQAFDAVVSDYGVQTPIDTTPKARDLEPTSELDGAFGYTEASDQLEDGFVEDDWDEEPTQVFVGVAPVALSKDGSPVPALEHSRGTRRRRASVAPRRVRVWSEDESLIAMSATAPPRRPSDIGELLDKMSVSPMSKDELYDGLKGLSRIDVSPVAPPVGVSWMDEDGRK